MLKLKFDQLRAMKYKVKYKSMPSSLFLPVGETYEKKLTRELAKEEQYNNDTFCHLWSSEDLQMYWESQSSASTKVYNNQALVVSRLKAVCYRFVHKMGSILWKPQ
jgi:hypothetical protein